LAVKNAKAPPAPAPVKPPMMLPAIPSAPALPAALKIAQKDVYAPVPRQAIPMAPPTIAPVKAAVFVKCFFNILSIPYIMQSTR